MSDQVRQESTFPSTQEVAAQAAVPRSAQKSCLKRKEAASPPIDGGYTAQGLQEDKLIAVVAPAQFPWGQDVGSRASVTALPLKSIILAATLDEGEQRVPLLRRRQGLGKDRAPRSTR